MPLETVPGRPPPLRIRRPTAAPPPVLDEQQRAVVAHEGSPLLVLAGPGTGKTTTIVEAVLARLGGARPIPADQVLVLTFSRVAAAELRSRIVARAPAGQTPTVATFHSFAWQLLRSHPGPGAEPTGDGPDADRDALGPEGLLSGPDQELAVRELLAEPADVWARWWPSDRREALRSPGLVDELIGLLASARAHGWDPEALIAAARDPEPAGGPVPREWLAAGAFFEHYLQVLDWRGLVDYAEAIHRARLLVAQDSSLVGRYRAIYVDEYQDTDPAQVGLVRALAGPGTTVVAVGDPDQAIYRFRGADVRGILDFRSQFPGPDGADAAVVVLNRTRRFGPGIRAVADRWIDPVPLGGLPAEVQRSHRHPICDGDPGRVDVVTCRSAADQAAFVADVLRRAHLSSEAPLAWSDMAVLVRSGVSDIPRLQRALVQAGVPVEVPAGDTPLGHEPALAPLLTGLRLADGPDALDLAELESFLCSPLVGLTPLTLRRLVRSMRTRERGRARAEARPPLPAARLLADCFRPDAALPEGLGPDAGPQFDAILRTIDRMRQEAPADVHQQLWLLWCHGGNEAHGGHWARDLRARSLRGGPGAHGADVTLDAVVELFRVAERMPKGTGSGVFVDTLLRHRIPAARGEDAGFNRDAVRLLTVHRAKGAQWPLVVLVGLQQDVWPDARGPVSLLASERIGTDGVVPPRTRRELADDERRLAFVAATRAQRRLVITAVAADASDEAPSVLFTEAAEVVGATASAHPTAAAHPGPRERLTAASLVASLRTTLADPTASADLRDAAARRLAALARPEPGIGQLARQADPSRWWGLAEPTTADQPLIPPDQPVALSATAVSGINECPARWFLQRRAEASSPRAVVAGYGSLIHAAIAAVAAGEVACEVDQLAAVIEPAFAQLPFSSQWEAQRQWQRAQADLARFVQWFHEVPHADVAGEVPFDIEVPVADSDERSHQVRLTGSVDLVVAESEHTARVVDFKTGAAVPSVREVAENTQLGVYQLAMQEADEQVSTSGGSLVFLAKGVGKGGVRPTERSQGPLQDRTWLDVQLAAAAGTLADERIVATPGRACANCDFQAMCPAWSDGEWIE